MVNSTNDAWDIYLRQAKDYVDTGTLEEYELKYKREIARKLADARKAVLAETDDWVDLIKQAISNPLIHFIEIDNFKKWTEESPSDVRSALLKLWTDDDSSPEDRISAFCNEFPNYVAKGKGTRMNVISVLLMAVDVRRYPPFRITKFNNAYDRTGFEKPNNSADEVTLYAHALKFLDQLITETDMWRVPIHNRLEAQSVLWQISGIKDDDEDESETNDLIQPESPTPNLQALAKELYLTPAFLEKIKTLLDDKKQIIFQGPPGTGKTYVARELAYHLSGSQDRVTFVQFHPSYDYEDFIQGYRPVPSNGQPGFKLTNGPLLEAANRAREDEARNVKHFLVIDEINRGNLAKAFGELYFLLEYRDEAINLQYQQAGAGTFSLPSNLYIIGTMNTADRSIALVDLALRRRFYFVEFHPDDEPIKGVLRRWLEAKAQPDRPDMKYVADCVDKANELLKDNRHAAIGPSYFMKDNLDEEAVKRIWEHSVLPYIEELLFGEANRLDEFKLDKLR